MTLSTGSRLGPYEILAPLGAGGMGEVYRVRDPRLGREVAIKVLPASFSADSDRLRRFEQEARAAGILNHPNITAVFDIGEHDGAPYVVQELLEGETLRSALAGGRLAPRKAIDFAIQIAHGLAAAHEKGIVHRDLKPENVFVTKDGRIKILDFGLAKLTHAEEGGPQTSLPTATAGTEPGVVLGTLGYMSPEQVRGKAADARSDIFSFGAILYEMLSGKRAFHGDSAADTMSSILKEDPPELSVTNQAVSPGLERIVRHCLEKNAEQRFRSAHDLAFDLEALSTLSSSSAASPARLAGRRAPRRVLIAAASALALVLAFFAGERLSRGGHSTGSPTFRRLTFRRGNILSARFAPDGQTVVYGAAWEGQPSEIYSARTDSTESRPQGIARADVLSVSSRGELALLLNKVSAFVPGGQGTLARVPLGGSGPREILEDVLFADWDPNGEDLAVVRLTAEGKSRLEYPVGHLLYESFFLNRIRVSPSGDLVACQEFGADNRASIKLVDRKGAQRVLTKDWAEILNFAWSRATGELFFIARKTAADSALRAVSLSGRERLIYPTSGAFFLHDIAADGRLLLERATAHWGVSFVGPGESRERELAWLDRSSLRDISDDGRLVLFAEGGEGGGPKGGVFLRKTDGSAAVRLGDGDPQALSPDGKWALVLSGDSPPELRLLPTGAGAPKKVPVEGIAPISAVFLRDGRIVIFHSAPGEPPLLSVVAPEGGHPRRVEIPRVDASANGVSSYDSTRVAYATTQHQIMIAPIAGGAPQAVSGGVLEPTERLVQWSADGRFLLTVKSGEIPMRIRRIDIETGQKTLWKEIQPADASGLVRIANLRITPDGRAYAYSTSRVDSSDLYVVDGMR